MICTLFTCQGSFRRCNSHTVDSASMRGRGNGETDVAQHGKVMVFDFDGTVSLGDGPVRSYARFVAAGLEQGDHGCDC